MLNKNKLNAFIELCKPRITIFQLFVVSIGYFSHSNFSAINIGFLYLLIGTLLISASACILNHVLEADYDALMQRTAQRPIVTKKIQAKEAIIGAALLCAIASVFLLLVNEATFFIAVLTLLLYVYVYTPLKRKTWLNTFVGGIPGSLPILGGWLAFRVSVSAEVWFLMLILFLWQIPHFFALALLYEHDYKQAGFKMISKSNQSLKMIDRQIFLYLILLLFSVLLPLATLQYGLLYVFLTIGSVLFCFKRFFMYQKSPSDKCLKTFFLSTVLFVPCWIIALIMDQLFFIAIL